jgi:hypothetical protein
MVSFPSVDVVAVVGAAVVMNIIGAGYWTILAPRLARIVGGSAAAERLPPSALAVAVPSRLVIAGGLAVVVGWAATTSPLGGATVGLLLAVTNTLTYSAGVAAFGRIGWGEWRLSIPQVALEWAIGGALLATWR